MSVELLRDPSAITPAWLQRVLDQAGIDATVRDLSVRPVGTGQMGACLRLTIEYAAGEGPPQLIVKLPAPDADDRAALGHRCEAGFYREMADRVAIRTPRCYFAGASDDGTAFTLVLEDVAPATQGDQIQGCSVEAATAAARNLAGLHAPTWNDTSMQDLPWIIPDLVAMPDLISEFVVEATTQFLDLHEVAPSTEGVLRDFAGRFLEWASARPTPRSLIHSDYRLDNLLFPPPGSSDPVIAVDWAVVMYGLPARDLAFLVGTGLETELRRAGERSIVAAYRDRLVELGVPELEVEQCWDDYRYGLFQGPMVTVLGAYVAHRTERGDEMFTVMADRSAAAILDLDAASLF